MYDCNSACLVTGCIADGPYSGSCVPATSAKLVANVRDACKLVTRLTSS